MTLFLPPFRTGQGGGAALDRSRQGHSRTANFGERPTRFDAHIHVHAARAAGFRPASKADLIEKALHFKGHAANIIPADAGNWIEIDAQFVGMIEICGAHRMRVQFDAAKVHNPGQPGWIIDHDFFGSAAGRERQCDRTQPSWPLLGRALLIECLRLGAVDETFQNDRSILNPCQRTRSDGEIVADEVELGDFYLRRKIQLLRVRDLDFPPVDREHFMVGFLCHNTRLPPIIIH